MKKQSNQNPDFKKPAPPSSPPKIGNVVYYVYEKM